MNNAANVTSDAMKAILALLKAAKTGRRT